MSNVIGFPKAGQMNDGRVPAAEQQVYDRTPIFPQESSLYFPVYEVPLAMCGNKNFHRLDGYKALARADEDGKPIGLAVVGENYKVVQNKDLFQAIEHEFEAAIGDFRLDGVVPDPLEGVKVYDKMSYNGAICLREYIFPNMRCRINDKSDIAFRTIVVNGFGGSSVKLYTGAIDFFCTNGMVRGQFDHTVLRHSKNLEIKGIADRVKRSIDVFYKDADMYRAWASKSVRDADAMQFFENIGMSERLREKMMRQFLIEVKSHGPTIWALYSAMTYYATHDEGEFALRKTDNNHAASTLLKREESVKKWIEHEAWQQIAA